MSTQNTPVRSRRSRLLALVTTMLVAFSGLVVMPTAANAAEGDVTNATLDWGVKASWRGYIGNPGNVGGVYNVYCPRE